MTSKSPCRRLRWFRVWLVLCSLVSGTRAATLTDLLPLSFTNAPGQVLPYRLWVPKPLDPARRYPVVLFLHGAGERGADNQAPLSGTPDPLSFLAVEYQATWPCFFIAPQCPSGLTWAAMNQGDNWGDVDGTGDFTAAPSWPLASVMKVLGGLGTNSAYAANVDTNQFLITGLSMGGYGTWDAISRWPGVFRSAIPICGGGDPDRAAVIGSTRVWAFHAADDSTVPVVRSRQMIDSLRRLGGMPRFTEYPASLGIGHGSWQPAYADPAIVPWMFGEPDSDKGFGVLAEYFGNTNFTGTASLRRIERSLDHDWASGTPGSAIPANRFGARYTTLLHVTNAGDYTLSATADDQVSVWLDDLLVIQPSRIMSNAVTAALTLTAGDHLLRADFVEDTGNARVRISWGPSGLAVPVPQYLLLSPADRVAAPHFDPPPGVYASNVFLALSSTTPGAVIRYTRDGTAPTSSSITYTNPIVLTEPGLVRAQAFKPGLFDSVGVAADYRVAPYFISQPKGGGVAVGSNFTFTATAVGSGTLRYQWAFVGIDLPGATNTSLVLTNLALDQGGTYDVTVTDDQGSRRSQAAVLVVAIRPSVVEQPVDMTALQGETVMLSVTATGSTPLSFRWRRGTSTVLNQTLAANVSRLILTNVNFANAGNYTVIVTNMGGAAPATSNALLTVLSDSDHDGMPDAWETEHGLNPMDPADADLDPDLDGMSNRAEFVAATDPGRSDQVLRLGAGLLAEGGPAVLLSFAASSNRFYQINSREGIGLADWQPLVFFPPSRTNRILQFTNVVHSGSSRFYQLGVGLHP